MEPNIDPSNDYNIEEPQIPVPDADDGGCDELINAEVVLPSGDAMRQAQVLRRSRDADDNRKGRRDGNLLLDI